MAPDHGKTSSYFIGVDGGGTQTHAVMTDEQLNLLGEGFGGPGNFLRVGLERATHSVMDAVARALRDARASLARIERIGIGLAGVQYPGHRPWMRDSLTRAFRKDEPPFSPPRPWEERLFLTTDAEVALAGASERKPCVVVISGTGSLAYGMNRAGERARSGGWGPTFGDEGSGHDIARKALMAVVASYDGREPPTGLTRKICGWFGIETPEELPRVIYDRDRRDGSIVTLSQVVEEAAREGDGVARAILQGAGRDLARAVTAVIERLGMENETFNVCYIGSVFHAGGVILDPILDAVSAVAPNATVTSPRYPPAVGAVIYARNLPSDDRA
ncbi:MAG: hypothetical protein HY650_05065 [Acidobacteria bacterium]|nr:hypothetical protein [Acidobacteriota bacterium]